MADATACDDSPGCADCDVNIKVCKDTGCRSDYFFAPYDKCVGQLQHSLLALYMFFITVML